MIPEMYFDVFSITTANSDHIKGWYRENNISLQGSQASYVFMLSFVKKHSLYLYLEYPSRPRPPYLLPAQQVR